LFAQLQQVDRTITVLNLLLLGLVGLTPFIARMIAEAGPTRAMPYYFASLGSVLATVGLIRLWAFTRPALLHPQVDRRKWQAELLLIGVGAAGLVATGAIGIIQHRPIGTTAAVGLVVLIAVGRLVFRRFGR